MLNLELFEALLLIKKLLIKKLLITNIASGQELYFRKQPQNPYDGNAIGGFVRGLDELDRFLNFSPIL